MAHKTIFTVGLDLPDSSTFIRKYFQSNSSLLDADIILFEPTISYQTGYPSTYLGKPSLSESSSTTCLDAMKHWREELSTAFQSGKTIFIFLSEYEEIYYFTGQTKVSGTGKNAQTTNMVNLIDNYNMLPVTFTNKKIANGNNIKFSKDGILLKSYWDIVKELSSYEVYFKIENSKTLIETKSGNKIVGALIKGKNGGSMIFVPPLTLPEDFIETKKDGKEYWSQKSLIFAKALSGQIVSIDKALKSEKDHSVAPEWVSHEQFKLKSEIKHLADIEKYTEQINVLQDKINTKNIELEKSLLPKQLLYENGKVLEAAIINALQVIGFKAENYEDEESEFDIIFESAREGRFIGEAEGKDTAAINVTKFRQLESNIQEDFEKEHVNKHAKGVLFGNPHRLINPNDRKDFFTTKALTSAKRTGIALVNTHDLFPVVQYILVSKNKVYAKQVRECFKNTEGKIIKFPKIPSKV